MVNTSPTVLDTPQNKSPRLELACLEQKRGAFSGPARRRVPAPGARGNLAPMDEMKARRLRAQLVRKLNR
jgi:hypothetical protein